MEMTWTPERVEILNRLFEEGLPTSEIGRRMGLTKNTIIGRLHRNGMSRRETGPKFVPQRNLFEFSGPGCLWPATGSRFVASQSATEWRATAQGSGTSRREKGTSTVTALWARTTSRTGSDPRSGGPNRAVMRKVLPC